MPDIRDPSSEIVHIRYTKWDGSLHWHFDADLVTRDDHGTWVVVPPGGRYRRGTDPPRVDEHGFVMLIPDGGWWTAYFNAVPRASNRTIVYVDINTAPKWDGDEVTMADLDLDVILAPGGTARVIDQDEFDKHSVRYGYPPDVIDRVRAAAARIATEIDLGREPFASAGPIHLARTLGWAHGVVVAGHGVASGSSGDPRFPLGTIVEQIPAFAAAGLPAHEWFYGTINVDLGMRLVPRRPRTTIEHLEWKSGYPPESFAFFDARISVDDLIHHAFGYRPHPETKPEFHQDDGVLELVAPEIAGIRPGTLVSVWVDPDQADWDVA